ncbi:hypothetical protein ACT2FY_38940 [Paraburkholderia fungorum]|uniref:hypothetical protein n=1 Tax=Paraburkholderia fungorum TaxID=134537 RepID=UPI00402BC648
MYKNALKAIPALVAALILSACGGGGGGSSSGADAASSASTPLVANPTITFAGNASVVTGVAGSVSVLFAPATLTGNGVPQGTSINSTSVPLSAVVQESSHGAFTTVASSSTSTIAETGSVYDIGGVDGTFAIGRWTDGSDTSGGTYNKNQGATYAVGSPLTLTAGTGTMTCQNVKATAPTTVAGSVSPGILNSATATLDLATLTLKNLNINVSIGSDNYFVINGSTDYSIGATTSGGGVTVSTRAMGNAITPYVAIAYGAHATNSGDINGLVVLNCTKPA